MPGVKIHCESRKTAQPIQKIINVIKPSPS